MHKKDTLTLCLKIVPLTKEHKTELGMGEVGRDEKRKSRGEMLRGLVSCQAQVMESGQFHPPPHQPPKKPHLKTFYGKDCLSRPGKKHSLISLLKY